MIQNPQTPAEAIESATIAVRELSEAFAEFEEESRRQTHYSLKAYPWLEEEYHEATMRRMEERKDN